ncbi:MAG: hypothetical protein EAZ13_01915 [Sphingobacteriia bacterium]|nr:MAG: hypothetical protein EAZ13_01915 [Sphingobacteriia bacterium]
MNRSLFFLMVFTVYTFFIGGCTKNVTQVYTVYTNNFNNTDLKGVEVLGWLPNGQVGLFPSDAKFYQYQGSNMIGRLNNSRVGITISDLPPHTVVRAEFDLYLHEIWKNDIFVVRIDENFRLVSGFSNDSSVQQSYPNWIGNGTPLSPAGNLAQEIYLPSTCGRTLPRGTSHYKMIHLMPHTSSKVTFDCSDTGGALNDTCSRSWSIDNLKITVLKNQ